MPCWERGTDFTPFTTGGFRVDWLTKSDPDPVFVPPGSALWLNWLTAMSAMNVMSVSKKSFLPLDMRGPLSPGRGSAVRPGGRNVRGAGVSRVTGL